MWREEVGGWRDEITYSPANVHHPTNGDFHTVGAAQTSEMQLGRNKRTEMNSRARTTVEEVYDASRVAGENEHKDV